MKITSIVFLLIPLALLSGCATVGPSRYESLSLAAKHVEIQSPTFDSAGIAVPIDIREEIVDTFKHEARRDGLVVVNKGSIPVVFRVRGYRRRNRFARWFLGVLDGRDYISMWVRCNGQAEKVSDSGYLVFTSIHEAAREAGRKAADRVAMILAADQDLRNP